MSWVCYTTTYSRKLGSSYGTMPDGHGRRPYARVVSTAYYAVFHALGYRVSRQIVGVASDKYDLNASFDKVEAETAIRRAALAISILKEGDKGSKLYEELFLLSLVLQGPLKGRA